MEKADLNNISKIVGSMSTFNDMLSCGAKKIALGIPMFDPLERDLYLNCIKYLCEEKGNKWYKDDDALITDLFPVSMNKNKHNTVFYRHEVDLQAYLELKARKKALVATGNYNSLERYKLAYDFGILLSYNDEAIKRMISENTECEVIYEPENKFPATAQISFLYFDDTAIAHKFFKDVLCLPILVNDKYDYYTIYKTSETSYIGVLNDDICVDDYKNKECILISFIVKNIEELYLRIKKFDMIKNLTLIEKSERYNIKMLTFIGPGKYRFEIKEFFGNVERKFFYNEY